MKDPPIDRESFVSLRITELAAVEWLEMSSADRTRYFISNHLRLRPWTTNRMKNEAGGLSKKRQAGAILSAWA